MENLPLLYEDIKIFGYFILMIVACCTIGITIVLWLGKLLITKKLDINKLYTIPLSSFIFFVMYIFLANTEISDIQYKQISIIYTLNNSNVKTKIFDITKDNIITKQEYISLFTKKDGLLVEENSTHFKGEALKMINNNQM